MRNSFYLGLIVFSGLFICESGLADLKQGELKNHTITFPHRRPVQKEWDPHLMVAGMLERLSESDKKPWGNHSPDAFESELNLIRLRLRNIKEHFNEAELGALASKAERLEKAQDLLLKRIQSIEKEFTAPLENALKEDTLTAADKIKKENLEQLIQVLELRFGEAKIVKEQISHSSQNAKINLGEQK